MTIEEIENLIKERDYYKARYLEFNNAFIEGDIKPNTEAMVKDLEKRYEIYRENEIWKDIEGYEGLYQVSNLGNVKSIYYSKNKILKPQKDSSGYMQVRLCKNRKTKLIFVHRLVRKSIYS